MVGQAAAGLGGQIVAVASKGGGINLVDFAKQGADFTQFGPFKILIFAILGTLAAGVIICAAALGLINTGRFAFASVKANEMHSAAAMRGMRQSLSAMAWAAVFGGIVFATLTLVNAFTSLVT